jgi:hypothetical protein
MAQKQYKELLDRLGSPRAEVSQRALDELRDVSVERFASLSQVYSKRGLRVTLITMGIVVSVLMLVLFSLVFREYPSAPHNALIACSLAGIALFAYFVVQCRRCNKVERLLAQVRSERIGQGGHTGLEQLTSALDSLYYVMIEEQNSIADRYAAILQDKRPMMIRELYALTTDEATLLADNQRLMLNRWIGTGPGHFNYMRADLGLAAMDALAKANDAQAVGQIKRLAASPQITANMKRVRQAASKHLKSMQERRAERERESTLLRASAVPTEPQVLLIPAQSTGSTPGDELLRPK